MKKTVITINLIVLLCGTMMVRGYADSVAKIKRFEGAVSVLKKGAEKWREARVNMPLNIGDAVYAREESFAEIVYSSGALLRMDEDSKIIIEDATENSVKTSTTVGNVWANMRKLVSSKKEFELSSPTATAAIRGTVFQMEAKADSSTDISVFQGKVAVGPGKGVQQPATGPGDVVEVPGPEEVPGPYEVTLDQWRMIVAGQMISVNKQGKFSEKKFDAAKASKDDFVKKNLELDKELESEQKKDNE
jgi:hypothetical protein